MAQHRPQVPQRSPKSRWLLTEAFLAGFVEVDLGCAYGDAWQRASERFRRPNPWTGYSGVSPNMSQPSASQFEAYMDGTYSRISRR